MLTSDVWQRIKLAVGEFRQYIESEQERSLQDMISKLQPGDVVNMTPLPYKPKPGLVGGAKGLVADAFNRVNSVLNGPYAHSSMYAGDGKIIEARPGRGVQEVPLQKYKALGLRATRPDLDVAARAEAVERARQRVGKAQYSLKSTLPVLEGAFTQVADLPNGAASCAPGTNCSALVAGSYPTKVVPQATHATGPGMLGTLPEVAVHNPAGAPTPLIRRLGLGPALHAEVPSRAAGLKALANKLRAIL